MNRKQSRSAACSTSPALRALSRPSAPLTLGRRRFLQGALMAGGLAAVPSWVGLDAEAHALGATDHILVVLQLDGGNDGLNMVIPAENGRYQDARGSLAISPAQALPIGNGHYFHPNMPGVMERYRAGNVAVIQGVGESADEHSHFSSMARWMSGTPNGRASPVPTGWLGRWFDAADLGEFGMLNVGNGGVPLHMHGTKPVVALSTGGDLLGSETAPREALATNALRDIGQGASGLGPMGDKVAETFGIAMDTARVVDPIYAEDGLIEDGLARDMQLAARVINMNIGTRILGVTQGKFDQHDDQLGTHADNLAAVDAGITAFFDTLEPQYLNRVTIMTFSEFGRSFSANDSRGTDHGTASTSLVIGAPVAGGFFGAQPSFAKLDKHGDLEHTVDFRSVYATMIDNWLGGDSTEILERSYPTIDLFAPNVPATPAPAITSIREAGAPSAASAQITPHLAEPLATPPSAQSLPIPTELAEAAEPTEPAARFSRVPRNLGRGMG